MTRQIFDQILDRLEGVKRSGDSGELAACCPCSDQHRHGDRKQSFHICMKPDGTILFHCKAGCSQESLNRALGVNKWDLFVPKDILPFSKASKKPQKIEKPKRTVDLVAELKKCEADENCITGVKMYAERLGLPFQILWDMGCRWKRIEIYPKNPKDRGELWYPETDHSGKAIGIGIRSWDSSKCFVTGGHRGLILFPGVLDRPGPIYLVEGLTDTVALLALGLCAIGRPSNTGGVHYLAKLLAVENLNREIIVVGENDKKDDGSWPGRSGADQTAKELAALLKREVKAALLPLPFKDSREWFLSAIATSSSNPALVYHQSLSIFAVHPARSIPVTEEEIEAASIPYKPGAHYAYPDETCQRPGHMLLWHKMTYKLRHVLNRCGSSTCPHCFKRKKRLRHESLVRHFDSEKLKGGNLFCTKREMTPKEWSAIRRSIKRHEGNFVYFRHPGEIAVIISTVEFRGSENLPFEKAEQYAKDAVTHAIVLGKNRPFFSSSVQWAMKREKEESQYERLGTVKMPPQMVEKICQQELGKQNYKKKRPEDSTALINGYINYVAMEKENDPFVKKLLANTIEAPGESESKHIYMHDSDTFPPNDYWVRCLPWWWDDCFAWWMDPTG